ncbi:PD-(D/E)XK motif protein [Planctellipticum variicoloris]|nr:PD-(D/E)XK motif protein [Planctomycetaceae bacterium SH412]
MAQPTDQNQLLAAWRALDSTSPVEGWRTIDVACSGPCRARAGRYFPGNEESLLIRFVSVRVPPTDQLPRGRGFVVSRVETWLEGEPGEWLGLRRQRAGSLELFALMASDLVSLLAESPAADEARLLSRFLGRIRAWQEFMRRAADGVLTAEAEVGLAGELELLGQLLALGVLADVCVAAWEGPADGLQDFRFGTGAIEAKSTLAFQGFPAWIGSLDQLDDAAVQPLFLAGVRLSAVPTGRTLPEIAADLRDVLAEDAAASIEFGNRLLQAGYREEFAERYTRRFSLIGVRVLTVGDGFPRLTRGLVPPAIRAARYEIDLDLVTDGNVDLVQALQQLGVL